MKKAFLPSLIAVLAATSANAFLITNNIDSFTAAQYLDVNNSTATNTTPFDSSVIGGYRTVTLGSSGGSSSSGAAYLEVLPDDTTLTLSSGNAAKASFQVIWGGAGGTNGLGGIQFGGGQALDLSASFLSFSLQAADLPSSGFTWSFTDLSSVTATYAGSFPATESAIPYNISLDSFANANGIDWNAINLITFSGGNVTALDLTIDAPIQIVASTVPEPGTFALLIVGLGVAGIYVRCRKKRAR